MTGSWKTTTVGIAGAIVIIATQIVNLLDNDPNTIFSIEALFAALAVLGIGWFARDNNKSSEDVGLK